MRAEIRNGRIELEESDSVRDRMLVRKVPGRKYDTKAELWHVPLSFASCCALRGVFGQTLEVGDALAEWARTEITNRINPALTLRGQLATDSPAPGVGGLYGDGLQLYPFQVVGASFLVQAERALLADEMGTGKTAQLIAALRALDAKRVLVICPNSVKRVWAAELARWWPDVDVEVFQAGAKGKKAAELVRDFGGVLIVNWENTWRQGKLAGFGSVKLTEKDKAPKLLNFVQWDAVVCDEAHRMKEPRAKQTRATWALQHAAKYRFAATGTPVANSPRDLWSIMHGVAPEEYPAITEFVDRYGLLSWNQFGGLEVVGLNPETRDEFFKFFDPRFLRRTKELVLPDLPPKTYQRRYCTLPAKQKKAYLEIEKQMLTELDSGDVAYVTSPLAKLTRLRQLAGAYVDVSQGTWELAEPSGKLDELDDVLEEAGDEQVVVFAEHRKLVELYAERLDKRGVTDYGMITGKVSEEERQQNVDNFQDGKLRLMLVTLGAGGEGLTLTAASLAVFLQRSFSAVKDSQAEDRLHRVGQERNVEIVDLVAENTVEERVFQVLDEKGERLEEVCRDQDTLRRLLGG